MEDIEVAELDAMKHKLEREDLAFLIFITSLVVAELDAMKHKLELI